jgi:hypothetical protein
MQWTQVITIIVTLLGGIFYIHNDVKEIRKEMLQQGNRIDKLYEMFVDLLKSKNTP